MEVKLTVTEEQFKEILEKGFNDLQKETIQEVIIQSIKEYFTHDNYKNLNAFIVDKESYGYGSKTASRFLIDCMEDCDYSGLQEVVDLMIKDLKENYHKILIEILSDRLMRGLADTWSFQDSLENTIRKELNNYHNINEEK
jgi:hypothetical protein